MSCQFLVIHSSELFIFTSEKCEIQALILKNVYLQTSLNKPHAGPRANRRKYVTIICIKAG